MSKILLVEDDPDTRLGLSIRLRAAGHETAIAADGASAVAALRTGRPDLVILDLGLPAGDGFMVMARLSALNPTSMVPIIVLSARDPASSRDQALKSGAAAYFQKPADNVALLEAVQRLAAGNSSPGAKASERRRMILIVEDDADTRLGLATRLRSEGFDTILAADGSMALVAAQKERPDLVLLDLGLPAGDGFMVLGRLKALTALAAIPVIVLSARGEEAGKTALEKGAVAFLTKPADKDLLLATIARALDPTA